MNIKRKNIILFLISLLILFILLQFYIRQRVDGSRIRGGCSPAPKRLIAKTGRKENEAIKITDPKLVYSSVLMTIVNYGDSPDKLVSVFTPNAKASLYVSRREEDMQISEETEFIELPPKEKVILSIYNGYFIYLEGLRKPANRDESSFPVTLEFENADKIKVNIDYPLKWYDPVKYAEQFLPDLENTDSGKRLKAAQGIVSVAKEVRSLAPRITHLMKNHDPAIRRTASAVLIYMKEPTTIPILKEYLEEQDKETRFNMLKALALMKEKSIASHLAEFLYDSDPKIQSGAGKWMAILIAPLGSLENVSLWERNPEKAKEWWEQHKHDPMYQPNAD
jgi:copper(I)-binding protein